MELDALVNRFPRIWHVTFEGGWEGIRSGGLQSSLDLLTAVGRADEASQLRSEIVTIDAPSGPAILRDQTPTRKDPDPEADGISPAEWWTLLNSRSYLFASDVELDKMLEKYLSQGHVQEVITFETRRLLTPVIDHVHVSTVAAGVFPRASGTSRGRSNFVPLAEFAGVETKIREITITTTAPVTDAAVISVVRREQDQPSRRIWPPVKVRA